MPNYDQSRLFTQEQALEADPNPMSGLDQPLPCVSQFPVPADLPGNSEQLCVTVDKVDYPAV